MAIQGRQGEDWDADELDAIIADYFVMLGEELAHRPYVKAHHRAALMQLIGRSAASIEFKHRNISAVLEEINAPRISGYLPAGHRQEALYEAVVKHVAGLAAIVDRAPIVVPKVYGLEDIFTDIPQVPILPPSTGRERLVRKLDPVERDFRNRQLGRAGEEFVVDLERKRLANGDRPDLAHKVRWVAMEDGDGAGYDVLSFDLAGKERLIEVKTTNGAAQTPFFMTRNEMAVAAERPEHWHLYRVHLFFQQPKIYTVRPPLEGVLNLNPETWRASPLPAAAGAS